MPTPMPASTSCAAAFTLVQMHTASGFRPASANQANVLRYIAVGGGVVMTVKRATSRGDAPAAMAKPVDDAHTFGCSQSRLSRRLRCPMTVDVDANELQWHFGPGWWTYRLALDEIQTVAIVRNHWWNGFGIRTRPGFRLYNVSGLDAVELHLKSGQIRRIGTDDPQGLAAALKS